MREHKTRVGPATLVAVPMAAVLASVLGGCGVSSGPVADGPLGGAARGGYQCVPARVGEGVTFGDQDYTNDGHRTLVVDRAVLRDPHRLRVLGSYAVPGKPLIGAPLGWPPRYRGMPPTWRYRQSVRGFRLAPGKSFNMVFGLAATGVPRGQARGVLVYYHDSAGRYVLKEFFGVVIDTRRSCP